MSTMIAIRFAARVVDWSPSPISVAQTLHSTNRQAIDMARSAVLLRPWSGEPRINRRRPGRSPLPRYLLRDGAIATPLFTSRYTFITLLYVLAYR